MQNTSVRKYKSLSWLIDAASFCIVVIKNIFATPEISILVRMNQFQLRTGVASIIHNWSDEMQKEMCANKKKIVFFSLFNMNVYAKANR